MSNRLFQSVIHQMKDAVGGRIIGVIDETGVIIACSELVKIGEVRQSIRDEMAYSADMIVTGGCTYRPLTNGTKREYITFVEGEDAEADMISRLLAVSLSNIKNLYDEKYDKGSFIKNVVLDNILPSDIYIKSKDLGRAYKEAQIALDVGKVFETDKNVISYENLGIGRLIYQLPTTLCEMFLQEVFKKGSLESLDRETLMTIQCFFENNLNVSETSRKLFVHRNTLVYRLEKIRKLTGLDLREFEHAITFKVALMVKKYLNSKNPAKV